MMLADYGSMWIATTKRKPILFRHGQFATVGGNVILASMAPIWAVLLGIVGSLLCLRALSGDSLALPGLPGAGILGWLPFSAVDTSLVGATEVFSEDLKGEGVSSQDGGSSDQSDDVSGQNGGSSDESDVSRQDGGSSDQSDDVSGQDGGSSDESDPANRVAGKGVARMLVIYELYYSEEAWPILHTSEPFRGLCVAAGQVKPNSNDIDAPTHLPILQDPVYQKQLCEYGAIFTLAKDLSPFQGEAPWIGFQSWQASRKGFALDGDALKAFEKHLVNGKAEGRGDDSFYYWATASVWTGPDFYWSCDAHHTSTCSTVFSAVFDRIFFNDSAIEDIGNGIPVGRKDAALPPMPTNPRKWAYCSYFIMHVERFKKFGEFARMFFVTLESLYDLRSNIGHCPLGFPPTYDETLCWCFVMERVVNIWVYHTGTRMFWVDGQEGSNTGKIEEQLPLSGRTSMVPSLSMANLEHIVENFPKRLSPKSLELYKLLGGTI